MSFWAVHGEIGGLIFLFFLLVLPRITMLVAVATPFGLLAWIGWLICPRIVAAFIGTSMYWDTNPVLCVFAWLFALGATSGTTNETRKRVS